MSLLVDALYRQPLPRPPVWLMRQAGRYLPEYKAVRAKFPNFINFCLNPDAATEVTLQPVERFDLDAAIIFADILTIPHALGHTVTFTEGQGPRVTPFTGPHQLAALQSRLPAVTQTLQPVARTVAQTRAALPAEKAVIGFAGGPFTVACYMLDEKPAQGIPNTLALAQTDPQTFFQLLAILTGATTAYLSSQAEAGADALQLFESWAIACPPQLFALAVHAPLLAVAKNLKLRHPHTPIVLFPRGASPDQLASLAQENAHINALSLSTETNLAWAVETLQPAVAIQGNLNPALMTGAPQPMLAALDRMLALATPHPGYVVNLGHGLTPETKPENVQRLADAVRAWQNPAS